VPFRVPLRGISVLLRSPAFPLNASMTRLLLPALALDQTQVIGVAAKDVPLQLAGCAAGIEAQQTGAVSSDPSRGLNHETGRKARRYDLYQWHGQPSCQYLSTAPFQPIGRDRQMNIDRLSASALFIATRTTHMEDEHFTAPLAYRVWDTRYRWRDDGKVRDQSIEDTWRRVARALASVESEQGVLWEKRFYSILGGFRFVPGGRILAGAGTDRRVTLFNCFVMGTIEDSVSASFEALQEGALTMEQGGGIGCDFSSLRPSGDVADAKGGVASGPVSFMRVWENTCATLVATNARRGAMMATLCCDHPDIEQFIDAKVDGMELRHFNLSVLVSEAFMQALAADADWPLVFPCVVGERTTAQLGSALPREANAHDGPVYRRVRARDLWNKLMRANYDYAEPGVIF